MIVDISVIPGSYNRNIDRQRKVTPIFQKALQTLLSQKTPNMEIIVENIGRSELFRRKYPDPNFPGESPEEFCNRVEKEIKKII